MSENRYVPVGKIKIRETIKKHLDKRGYHYAYYNDLDMFSCEMGIGGRIPKYNLSLSVHEDRFVVWADIPVAIDDKEINEVCKYLQSFWRRFFGYKNNSVRYLKSVYCGDLIPEDKVINHCVGSACIDIEEIIGGIMEILYQGSTADEAVSKSHMEEIKHPALNTINLEGKYRLEDTVFGNEDIIDSVLLDYIKRIYGDYRVEYNEHTGNTYYVKHNFGSGIGELDLEFFPNDGAYSLSVCLPDKFRRTDELIKCLCEINYSGENKFKIFKSGRICCKNEQQVIGSRQKVSEEFISATINSLQNTINDNVAKIYEFGEIL